ncbi:threonine-phosphate decarboxylase [Dulcicalothrix desertica PCC 7102]|uniref:threonine-phosphate decarboxylase n=1 Tax=Dulcicalothrix desertica PCC 7102 TaxID=232991 RepID=A0A3S1D2N9_9CYAN|nr:threonine-phosphate decarboxylase CobD [Dulcicalothrix desertica]RUT02424.1 threonine-phosphate decarboxylase [Dulcicalothrix desertica PCC 7102]TWH55360.1 L-threonine O-3-phosphate decarboxylase [Dulcicalothrix desertica PCC 7102]
MGKPAHGGNLVWASALAGCPPSAILDFSASISPLGPPESVLTAIQSQLSNLRHYPDPSYSDLSLSLSHFHNLPSEWILPGNGSAELLSFVGRELSEFETTTLITPAFGDYYRALAAYNAQVLEFPLISGEWKVLSAELLEKLITHHSALSTHYSTLLLNNPHNPTGVIFSREDILPCLDKFALVVIDEAFMDFLPPDEQQSLISVVQDYPNLVILRSLTKFYSIPGLRLGYAIAHPNRLQRYKTWRDPWSVNTLASAAGVAALSDTEFQASTCSWLPKARKELFEGLSQIPGLQPLPSAANFLLVQSEHSCVELQHRLLKNHQILIRDCQSFPQLGDRFFRVAVRTELDNKRLLTALQSVLL